LKDFGFADNPNIPQTTIAALAEGSWIDDRESSVIITTNHQPERVEPPQASTRGHCKRPRRSTPTGRRGFAAKATRTDGSVIRY
jgi:hypothetical protein